MSQQEHVEVARAETARGELVLRRRPPVDGGTDEAPGPPPVGEPVLELRANGIFVMDSRETGTERALAEAALALVAHPREVLVGGLGLGATMQAVLADPRVERCTVVEIEPDLVDWMRDGTIPHGPALLADARAVVVVADVTQALAQAAPASYDLVLLDVDNGPDQLVHAGNAVLYDVPALTDARAALREGGVLVVWSAAESPQLGSRLLEVFGWAQAQPLDVRLQGRDERYWLHLARASTGTPTHPSPPRQRAPDER